MQADESLVAYIATTYYDITPIWSSIKPLCGYSDKNFILTDKSASSSELRNYVLKIVNKDESRRELTDIIDEILDNAYGFCRGTLPTLTSWPDQLSFEVPKLIKTTGNKLSTYTTVKYHHYIKSIDTNGREFEESSPEPPVVEMVKCNIKLMEYIDGITMFDYLNNTPAAILAKLDINTNNINNNNNNSPLSGQKDQNKAKLLYGLIGRASLELFMFLRTQRPLIEQLRRVRQAHTFPWQVKTCEPQLRKLLNHLYPKTAKITNKMKISEIQHRRQLVERVLDNYLLAVKPQLDLLPEFILHGDLCNRNILLKHHHHPDQRTKLCFIDFQDLQVGPQVIDLAILMFYQVIELESNGNNNNNNNTQLSLGEALKWIPRWLLAGYQSVSSCLRLSVAELMLVPELMKLRLCQSLLNGQMAYELDPSNDYVMHTNQRGWQLLELMSTSEDPTKLVAFWQAADE